jgi:hypothetical protein
MGESNRVNKFPSHALARIGFAVLLAPVALHSGAISAILAYDPLALWSLADSSGSTTAANSATTGSALNGVANNVTFGGPGPLQQATSGAFDGSTSNVSIANSTTDLAVSTFTLEAWVNLAVISGDLETIYGQQRNENATGINFGVFNGNPYLGVNDFSNNASLFSSDTINTGEWYFLAASYDGTDLNLYINGVLTDTENVGSLNVSAIYSNGFPATIGREFDGSNPGLGTRSINGSLADVAVFDYALSSTQVQAEYAAMPTPEPGSLMMLSSAFAGLAMLRLRRRS